MADVDTVRLLTGATTDDASDFNITDLLTAENGVIKLAAADLLELMAGRLQAVTSDDITVDGSKQAKTLMDRAAALREQHYAHGGDFYFDSTPVVADYASADWWTDADTSYSNGCSS